MSLTRDEVLAATPAQLNAALHATIGPPWGESRCRVCGDPFGFRHWYESAGCTPERCEVDSLREGERADAPPDYAGSWEGMRLVVEAMTTRANAFTLSIDDGRRIVAWFGRLGGGTGEAVADTAPLAVAQAALLALAEAP